MPSGRSQRASPLVATLGMFIIDKFSFVDPSTGSSTDRGLGDQIGGGGTYFAVGARIWLPPSQILMLIDRGHDFPQDVQDALEKYGKAMWRFRDDPSRETTKALNIYNGDERGFEYLTPRRRLDPVDLLPSAFVPLAIQPPSGAPAPGAGVAEDDDNRLPTWLHFICSPRRALEVVVQLRDVDRELRRSGRQGWQPRLCWEPIPDSCVPENLDSCLNVLAHLDVFSPNHQEAAHFLAIPFCASSTFSRTDIERDVLSPWLEYARKAGGGCSGEADTAECAHLPRCRRRRRGPVVVIRSGALGAVVGVPPSSDAEDGGAGVGGGTRWVDAYHAPSSSSSFSSSGSDVGKGRPDKVVDVTGAGNAFLGGLVARLCLHSDDDDDDDDDDDMEMLVEAARWGSVSAAFTVEQLGLPRLSRGGGSKCEGRHGGNGGGGEVVEEWNGERASDRVERLRRRRE